MVGRYELGEAKIPVRIILLTECFLQGARPSSWHNISSKEDNEMHNPNFIIYANGRITLAGLGAVARIKGLTSGGTEQNIAPTHKQVRVYDLRHGDPQPHKDFNMPAYDGSATNVSLAEAITEWLNGHPTQAK